MKECLLCNKTLSSYHQAFSMCPDCHLKNRLLPLQVDEKREGTDRIKWLLMSKECAEMTKCRGLRCPFPAQLPFEVRWPVQDK